MTQCEHLNSRCQMPRGHDNDVKCWFLCDDCGEEYQTDDYRCPYSMVVTTSINMPVSANAQGSQTIVQEGITQAIGEIFM